MTIFGCNEPLKIGDIPFCIVSYIHKLVPFVPSYFHWKLVSSD